MGNCTARSCSATFPAARVSGELDSAANEAPMAFANDRVSLCNMVKWPSFVQQPVGDLETRSAPRRIPGRHGGHQDDEGDGCRHQTPGYVKRKPESGDD